MGMQGAEKGRAPFLEKPEENHQVAEYMDWLANQGGLWRTRVHRPAWEMGVLAWGALYGTNGRFTRLVQRDGECHTAIVATLCCEGRPEQVILVHRIAFKRQHRVIQTYPAWVCQIGSDYFRGKKRILALDAQRGWLHHITTDEDVLEQPVPNLKVLSCPGIRTSEGQSNID